MRNPSDGSYPSGCAIEGCWHDEALPRRHRAFSPSRPLLPPAMGMGTEMATATLVPSTATATATTIGAGAAATITATTTAARATATAMATMAARTRAMATATTAMGARPLAATMVGCTWTMITTTDDSLIFALGAGRLAQRGDPNARFYASSPMDCPGRSPAMSRRRRPEHLPAAAIACLVRLPRCGVAARRSSARSAAAPGRACRCAPARRRHWPG